MGFIRNSIASIKMNVDKEKYYNHIKFNSLFLGSISDLLEYLIENNKETLSDSDIKTLKHRIKNGSDDCSTIYISAEDEICNSFEKYCDMNNLSYMIYTACNRFVFKQGDYKFFRPLREEENYTHGTFHDDLDKYEYYQEIADKYKNSMDILFGSRL